MVETTTFELGPDADETAFLDADRRVQTEFMPRQPGFLRRTTARGTDGQWLTVVLWRSDRDAEAASEHWGNHLATAELMSLVDRTTVRTHRYTTLD